TPLRLELVTLGGTPDGPPLRVSGAAAVHTSDDDPNWPAAVPSPAPLAMAASARARPAAQPAAAPNRFAPPDLAADESLDIAPVRRADPRPQSVRAANSGRHIALELAEYRHAHLASAVWRRRLGSGLVLGLLLVGGYYYFSSQPTRAPAAA